ncbi:PAS domain S-box-containing protein [Bacillus ectoiniformans]|uniref:sigma-54 interaction domain-containing protein n=1 Tax=Bacillus ectoiniformans TaxID=1494429 RepID=UPI0019578F12|nr:sigma 54-interacting transcriptional regulator [Bacillus ectoiniformans]MBM7648698.1 PAS domain S-box-containing protein [Bacillus ectoiniformans]
MNETEVTSAQKEIERLANELKQSKTLAKRYEAVIESSYDPIFIADKNGIGLKTNEAYTRITGVEPEKLIGRHMRDLVDEGIISDSITLQVLQQKERLTRVQTVNGKELLVTGNPIFDESGRISYVVTNLRDISKLNGLKDELNRTKALAEKYLQELEQYHEKEHLISYEGIIANSTKMAFITELAKRIAPVHSTVLLLGESGVGKEVIANLIQKLSDRRDKPFIKVNCAAIPRDLLESELFGYEKGAFTGAHDKGRPGLFEQAHGGTIFLDEIGEMPPQLQVKLLRVLQEFEVTRIGGGRTIKIDVRIISATNKDLEYMIEKGDFREDLYYRLNIVPIRIPPLRERKEDIPLLAHHFLNQVNTKYGLNKQLSDDSFVLMKNYSWPGNIREMQNMIERLAVTSPAEIIDASCFPFSNEAEMPKNPSQKTLKEVVFEVEREMILRAMAEHRSTRKAAEALGISQSALVKKRQKLGL